MGISLRGLQREETTTIYGLKNFADGSMITHTVFTSWKFIAGNYAMSLTQNQLQNFRLQKFFNHNTSKIMFAFFVQCE